MNFIALLWTTAAVGALVTAKAIWLHRTVMRLSELAPFSFTGKSR